MARTILSDVSLQDAISAVVLGPLDGTVANPVYRYSIVPRTGGWPGEWFEIEASGKTMAKGTMMSYPTAGRPQPVLMSVGLCIARYDVVRIYSEVPL